MRVNSGKVLEVQLEVNGQVSAHITCPPGAVPSAGQYMLAHSIDDEGAPLATALFSAGTTRHGFLAIASSPVTWNPGTTLELAGPLGRGFALPQNAGHIALSALGDTLSRLKPLAMEGLSRGAAVALFTDAPFAFLPASLEVYPLHAFPEALPWADYVGFDIPIEEISNLREKLGLPSQAHLPTNSQALIYSPMPCAGTADCGVCALPARRGWKLACKDGPVFDLAELEW